jgi:D-alanine transaminase
MANQYAMEQDCYETIFLRNGVVTEASHCNVFFVKDRVVYTHPADEFILDGITRQIVLKLCDRLGIEARLEGIPESEIQNMDEAFLTGTSSQITPIRKIDGITLYETNMGPVTQRLQGAFLKEKLTEG